MHRMITVWSIFEGALPLVVSKFPDLQQCTLDRAKLLSMLHSCLEKNLALRGQVKVFLNTLRALLEHIGVMGAKENLFTKNLALLEG